MIESNPTARATDDSSPEDLIALMNSLSDSTRLRLLRVLEREQLGVAELCKVLQLPQSTVSRHLKVLSQRDWVRSQQRGSANLYRMYTDELPAHAQELWRLARARTDGWASSGQDQLRLSQLISRRRRSSFFAQAVHEWEQLRARLYGSAFIHRAMVALLPAEWTVVDLGCGVGELVESLGERVRRVVGVDHSAQMLARARDRTAHQTNATIVQGELSAVPLATGSFDAAVSLLVLSYLSDPQAALQEMTRLLRPGGRGVVVTLLRHDRDAFRREMRQVWPGFDQEQIAQMLDSTGLRPDGCRAYASEPGAEGPALLIAAVTKTDQTRATRSLPKEMRR